MIHAAMRTRRSMILMKNAKRPPRADGAKEKRNYEIVFAWQIESG